MSWLFIWIVNQWKFMVSIISKGYIQICFLNLKRGWYGIIKDLADKLNEICPQLIFDQVTEKYGCLWIEYSSLLSRL